MLLPVGRTSRSLLFGAALLIGFATSSHAQLTTEDNVQKMLESQGYQDMRDVKFTSGGISAKAVKDGEPVSVVMDPTGKVMQRK